MTDILLQFISFVESYVTEHPGCTKDDVSRASQVEWLLTQERSVFHRREFAVRFSSASGTTFSNGVISLATLKKYDDKPFVVCIIRPGETQFLLANSTFLKKIGHSSQHLRTDNVRGTFLGTDILLTYADHTNEPKNFATLFEMHTEFSWEENLARLVEGTNAIVPVGVWFAPTTAEQQKILESPEIAQKLSTHVEYIAFGQELTNTVHANEAAILAAAQIDNVNVRGNTIEQIITQEGNFHGLQDLTRRLTFGSEVQVDIKTKIVTLQSSPKGYNIDKVLRTLARGDVIFSFFFVGINSEEACIRTCLVSIVDRVIIDMTRVQFHWAGRNSRGVTQLTGNVNVVFTEQFAEEVDIEKARRFLASLIDIGQTYEAKANIEQQS